MATITIENVPDNIVKIYGTKTTYENIKSSFLPKKREINRLDGLSKEEIEKEFYNKNDDTYGPFVGVENSTFLSSLMK